MRNNCLRGLAAVVLALAASLCLGAERVAPLDLTKHDPADKADL